MNAAAIAQALDEYATPGFAFSPAALPLPVLLPSGASVPLGSLRGGAVEQFSVSLSFPGGELIELFTTGSKDPVYISGYLQLEQLDGRGQYAAFWEALREVAAADLRCLRAGTGADGPRRSVHSAVEKDVQQLLQGKDRPQLDDMEADIEAESAADAKRPFVALIVENLDVDNVIANNLANVSTNGFKRGRAVFEVDGLRMDRLEWRARLIRREGVGRVCPVHFAPHVRRPPHTVRSSSREGHPGHGRRRRDGARTHRRALPRRQPDRGHGRARTRCWRPLQVPRCVRR
jgi:hypothetical protein